MDQSEQNSSMIGWDINLPHKLTMQGRDSLRGAQIWIFRKCAHTYLKIIWETGSQTQPNIKQNPSNSFFLRDIP